MRQLPLITGAVCALAMAATAEAQTTVERVWIDVNVGSAWAAEDSFLMTASVDRSHEPADFAAHYHVPRNTSFDFGGGVHAHADRRRRHQRRRQRARGAGGSDRAACRTRTSSRPSPAFTRIIGVGGFARYGRGAVDLENTVARALGRRSPHLMPISRNHRTARGIA